MAALAPTPSASPHLASEVGETVFSDLDIMHLHRSVAQAAAELPVSSLRRDVVTARIPYEVTTPFQPRSANLEALALTSKAPIARCSSLG